MSVYSISKRWERIALAVLLTALAGMLMAVSPKVITGDEPRYILFAASIWGYGDLVMPESAWVRESAQWLGYAMDTFPLLGDGTVLGHPVYVSALLSPLASFGLDGLRGSGLTFGVLGLAALYGTLRSFLGFFASIFATLCAGALFPLLPYLHSFSAEPFLFAAIATGLMQLPSAGKSRLSDFFRAAIILAIPFVHLRGAVIGAAIFVAFWFRVFERCDTDKQRLFYLGVQAVSAACVLFAMNLFVYGTVTGSVSTARPPMPFELFDVVATNLVTIKGMLPYAPIWILGFAGLLRGAWRANRLSIECCAFTVVAITTSIGVNPGEGWPGRFLIASIPMLSIGLGYWLSTIRHNSQWLLTALLFILSSIHTIVFLLHPNKHLENRQSDVVFQYIYDQVGLFNFGLILPVEGIDIGLARAYLLVAMLLILLSCATLIWSRRFISIICFAMALAVLELTRFSELSVRSDFIESEITLNFTSLPKQVSVSYGRPWEIWYLPPYPTIVSSIVTNGMLISTVQPANQVIGFHCYSGFDSLRLRSEGFDLVNAVSYRLRAFESSSVLYQGYLKFFRVCK